MDEVKESSFFDQLHGDAKSRGLGDGPNHEYDVGVTVLSQHVHFIVEFLKKLLADVGVEHFLNRYLQLEIFPLVDRAKPTHRNLLPNLQVVHPEGQHSVH